MALTKTTLPQRSHSCGGTETHAAQSAMPIREIIAKMRHDGCGGRVGRVELLTGIEAASSRLVRKIVLRDG